MKTPEFSATNPLIERLSNSAFKAVLKCKNHPSIAVIKNANNNNSHFLSKE